MQFAGFRESLSIVLDHWPLFALLLIAVPPVAVLSLRFMLVRRAAEKSPKPKILLGYREGDGKPVYFDPKTGFSESPEQEPNAKPANKPRVTPINTAPAKRGVVRLKKK